MQAAGVPTVPGSDGLVRTPDEAFTVAKQVLSCNDAWAFMLLSTVASKSSISATTCHIWNDGCTHSLRHDWWQEHPKLFGSSFLQCNK